MKNPWLKKNPFLSMWLSGANTVASHARSQASAEASRQSKRVMTQGVEEAMKFWTSAWQPPAAATKRKKR